LFFAVTSCALDFNPTFATADGVEIQLNRNNLAEVPEVGAFADYFAPGATANARFYDVKLGGNPQNYKTFLWGHNDACLNLSRWWSAWTPAAFKAFGGDGAYRGHTAEITSPAVRQLRGRILVNTFAESAPTRSFSEVTGTFQVGVDRIQVRAVTDPSYKYEEGRGGGGSSGRWGEVAPPGSPRLQTVWECLRSPLTFDLAFMSGSNDPFARVPTRYKRYATGGYLIVSGFPGRNPDFARQRAALFFSNDERGAIAVSETLRRNERGHVVRVFDVAVLWALRPDAQHARALTSCISG
jgi:hypothetical protein